MIASRRLTAWILESLPELLPAFLQYRRWFGGRTRTGASADIEDAVWLPHPGRRCALVVAGIRYADGTRDRYSLLLAFDREPTGLPVVGPVQDDGETLLAVEAATDQESARALLQGFSSAPAGGLSMLRGGRLRYDDANDVTARALEGLERAAVEAVGADQSNSSLRVNRILAFKFVRKLEDGENPDLEISRFLATHTTFRAMPMVRGSLTYVSARGASATIGILQDWIDSEGDGWSHVVAQLQRPEASGRPALLHDVRVLGGTTADFHIALAAGRADRAFAPEPATSADAAAWRASLLERAARTRALVERQMPEWPEQARRLGGFLIETCSHLGRDAPVFDPGAPGAGFEKIRIHGDYHLGQTLKTPGGFVLIDFEGEPARPLAERRSKESALKDVAGMIRSFDYAIAAAGLEAGDAWDGGTLAEGLRQAFLNGYHLTIASHAAGRIIPQDPGIAGRWIDFFELEKALYEVDYEMNHRPAWVHIPLQGIVRMASGRRRSEPESGPRP